MKALTNKQLQKIANGTGPTEIRLAAMGELESRYRMQDPNALTWKHKLGLAVGFVLVCLFANSSQAMMAGMIGSTIAGIDDAQQRTLQHEKEQASKREHYICDGQQVTLSDDALTIDGWRYATPLKVGGDTGGSVIHAFEDSSHRPAILVLVPAGALLQTSPESVAVCHK